MNFDANALLKKLEEKVLSLWKNNNFSNKGMRKGENDIVTETDLNFEKEILKLLQEEAPEVAILSEETKNDTPETGTFFTVDPVDGTSNYANGMPIYGTQIGLIKDDRPFLGLIYLPKLDLLLTGIVGEGAYINGEPLKIKARKADGSEVGISDFRRRNDKTFDTIIEIAKELTQNFGKPRMSGACCFDFAMVAQGSYQAKVVYNPHTWDVAPGCAIVLAAGGEIYRTKEVAIAATSKENLKAAQDAFNKAVYNA